MNDATVFGDVTFEIWTLQDLGEWIWPSCCLSSINSDKKKFLRILFLVEMPDPFPVSHLDIAVKQLQTCLSYSSPFYCSK